MIESSNMFLYCDNSYFLNYFSFKNILKKFILF